MFPAIRIQIENLDPRAHYCVYLEMNLASKCRYKYSPSLGWSPAGTEEAQSPHRLYVHPESPATGEQWMSQPISFGRLKLTNTLNPQNGQVVLSSMHKYQPRIIVVKSVDSQACSWAQSTSVVFPETQFIAVTAYQNDKITKLKIDNNPFAKGFRENGQAKCKRKRQSGAKDSDDTEEEIDVTSTSSSESNHDGEAVKERIPVMESSFSPSYQYKSPSPYCVPSFTPLNNNYDPSYMPGFYPGYPSSYYAFYANTSLCNTYANYGRMYNVPYVSKPVDYQPAVEKKPRLTDFSIRAITGIS